MTTLVSQSAAGSENRAHAQDLLLLQSPTINTFSPIVALTSGFAHLPGAPDASFQSYWNFAKLAAFRPSVGLGEKGPKRRKRTSPDQLSVLWKHFNEDNTPSAEVRQRLADQLGMSSRSVQIWFQNRRQLLKAKRGSSTSLGSPLLAEEMFQASSDSRESLLSDTSGSCTPSYENLASPIRAHFVVDGEGNSHWRPWD